MKNLHRFGILVLLGMAFFVLSCSKDDGPTAPETPNFENFSSYMWDYNSVLWFDLDYQDAKSGIASIYVFLTAKGTNASATLKINALPVTFNNETSYTEGRLYEGGAYASGPIQISTTQPVTYEIVYKEDAAATGAGTTYSGTMAVPAEVNGNFPIFAPTNNFAPNWVLGDGNTDPNFILLGAKAGKFIEPDDWTYLNYERQKAGTETNDTLPSTFWQPLGTVNYFTYDINPVVYEMKNSYELLTVGVSHDYYGWSSLGKQPTPTPKTNLHKIMEAIHADVNK
ncbi:MAG: hypothetical protein KA984_06285 [Candidatus Cloacimonetes bacterium]|nr:hypothetical protein [Candidatus Cloacimonadota bacterium]